MQQNELDYALGLGEHQVSEEEGRFEHAVGIAVLAYLLLMRACHQDISPGKCMFNKLVGHVTFQRGHAVAFAQCRLLCVAAMFHRSLSTG